jgi:mono/diheme cytochrome c family protein
MGRRSRLGAGRFRAKDTGIRTKPGSFFMSNTLRASLIVGALAVASAALAQDRAKIQAGAEVYAARCAMCHGERLRATGGAYDLLQLRPDERARFDQAVNDGKGQMPPWGGVLSAEEIDQLWAYLRSRADS